MKTGLYPRLAWTGISKNRKLYLPYLLTCTGMVMMYYLIAFLSRNPAIALLRGGGTLQAILGLGSGVVGVFSLIFLFYTNSFLIRRRKKEFGLYHILGMGKRNLTRILFWEGMMVSGLALAAGLFCGILFSKLSELALLNLMGGSITFTFWVDTTAVGKTLLLFAAIFLLIFLNTLWQIYRAKTVEMMHSETVGEKPPKANWILALLGVLILAGAYYIAVTIEDPIAAIMWFFVAVIMVIVASYLLFIAGSVALCRLLQKNKSYYYRTDHFVSISSMVYRMKRNGAGLASICILSTMVLVMVSTTVCLFIGTEDSLRTRYPRDLEVQLHTLDEVQISQAHQTVERVLGEQGVEGEDLLQYRYLNMVGLLMEDQISFDQEKIDAFRLDMAEHVRDLYVIPLEDYNRITGANERLEGDEVILATLRADYKQDTITLEGGEAMRVKKVVPPFLENGSGAMQIIPSIFIVGGEFGPLEEIFRSQAEGYGGVSFMHDYYAVNLSGGEEEQVSATEAVGAALRELQLADENFAAVSIKGIANERAELYGLNGGLFFLGVLLGSVFLCAAVLIMYYKQISEGYEDERRFEIMQKVGMDKREIKKSVNSQVLTVFFLPLLTAGIHMAFAFPMVSKLLMLFGLINTELLMLVTLCCYLAFALFYTLVYRITSYAYYDIVSGRGRK